MTTKIKRFNWRVKEQTAAELAQTYRDGGFRSWDEFMRGLLDRWNDRSPQPAETVIEREIKAVKDNQLKLIGQVNHFRLLLEGQTEALHGIQLDQEQQNSLVNRLNGFLQLAFELAGDKPQPQEPASKDASPEAEVLRQIRNRQLA